MWRTPRDVSVRLVFHDKGSCPSSGWKADHRLRARDPEGVPPTPVGAAEYPLRFEKVGERRYWQFQDRIYWENEDLAADEVYALLVTRQQRERGRIERAQAMVAMGMQPQDQSRRRYVIPDDVKQFVWMCDGGRCRQCGAQAELQYDHIIPVAMGEAVAPRTCRSCAGHATAARVPA